MDGTTLALILAPTSAVGGLVGMWVYLNRRIAGGELVPRHTVDFMRSLLEGRIAAITAERDKALVVVDAERKINEQQAAQLATLAEAQADMAEGQATVLALLEAFPAAIAAPRTEDREA